MPTLLADTTAIAIISSPPKDQVCDLLDTITPRWWNFEQYANMRRYMHGLGAGLECATDLQARDRIVKKLLTAEHSVCKTTAGSEEARRRKKRAVTGQSTAAHLIVYYTTCHIYVRSTMFTQYV